METKQILYLILAVAVLALIVGTATMYAVETREPFPPGNAPAQGVNFNAGPTPPGKPGEGLASQIDGGD